MWRGALAATLFVVTSAAHAQQSDTVTPRARRDRNEFDSRWLSLRLGAALVVDANGYGQNASSEVQVGDLANAGTVRFARGILSGAIKFPRPWDYLASVDASGLYNLDKPIFTVNDLAVIIPVGGHGHISLGRQKEGVTEQMMAPSRGIPFAERAAPVTAFVPTRNDGIRLWGSIPRAHGGWSIGAYDDWLFNGLSFRANGGQASARVFYAPIVSADSDRALQIAIDGRWSDDRDGTLQYKTKPEQNAAPNFANTGAFAASNGLTTDAELMALYDNVSFTAEVLPTRAWGTSQGTVTFVAYYAELSWRPGGQARPYNAETGSLGRVRVKKNKFAWEIGARFSRTNLDDGALQGGALDIASLSAGVYGPYATRILLDYGFSVLDKIGVTGRAQLTTLRFQWELR